MLPLWNASVSKCFLQFYVKQNKTYVKIKVKIVSDLDWTIIDYLDFKTVGGWIFGAITISFYKFGFRTC